MKEFLELQKQKRGAQEMIASVKEWIKDPIDVPFYDYRLGLLEFWYHQLYLVELEIILLKQRSDCL